MPRRISSKFRRSNAITWIIVCRFWALLSFRHKGLSLKGMEWSLACTNGHIARAIKHNVPQRELRGSIEDKSGPVVQKLVRFFTEDELGVGIHPVYSHTTTHAYPPLYGRYGSSSFRSRGQECTRCEQYRFYFLERRFLPGEILIETGEDLMLWNV